jgi:uncharacterized protein YcbK (DUF882 family)
VICWRKYKIKNMQLTKNFSRQEFDSKDGAVMPENVLANIRIVAENLQVLRDEIGRGIRVNSGYRSPEHNARIGGVKNSHHTHGRAADIVVNGMTPNQLADVIRKLWKEKKMKQGWLKVYSTFVHYDIR